MKILLVEDDDDVRDLVRIVLQEEGHTVETASTAAAGLELARANGYDGIVLDVRLPDGSGLDLMREVSRQRRAKGIALSGFGSEEDVQRSIAAGFAAHLTKPVPMSALHEAIARVIATRTSTAESHELSDYGHGRT